MKKLTLALTAALLFGFGFTQVEARSTPEKDMKKCCRKMKREVRHALEGPTYEYLKPDCKEKVTLICVINLENQVEVYKVKGEDKQLMEYIKTTINKEEIQADPKMAGKMFKLELNFEHQPA
ncbi:hypothetical protein [Carboxylicivirga sp. N1Y90]|uniref:hypothetical protein n=1 Tax=Carboxylicivirga fragile TaxID=3417571 RepID=UPI003D34352C|nr:hypothetical protein [Marinilabiliaceae bacterium N1Y90]